MANLAIRRLFIAKRMTAYSLDPPRHHCGEIDDTDSDV